MSITPQEKTKIENEIKNTFAELKNNLKNLKEEVKSENNDTKKQRKQAEIDEMEKKLKNVEGDINTLPYLQYQALQSLKAKLEEYKKTQQKTQGEVADLAGEVQGSIEKKEKIVPTTYELLKDSETYNKLLNIIKSNPNSFKDLKDNKGNELETPELKLEHLFKKIRDSIVLFMRSKLGNSSNTEKIINNTIAPAFERSLIELLKNQKHKNNVLMLEKINNISWGNFESLLSGISNFAISNKKNGSFSKFSQWMNAVDYLSVHNGVLRFPEKSAVLSNPLKFQEYMNDPVFEPKDGEGNLVSFSPYSKIDKNIFGIDENKHFEFGISKKDKSGKIQGEKSDEEKILEKIGDIKIENNPKTTALIAKVVNKSTDFFNTTHKLQKTANRLLDGINLLNPITKVFGKDIIGEISKSPEERSFIYTIIDFICKLIGITGGLEGIVKGWRLDRMKLTDKKNKNISQIFKKYKKLSGENITLSITDEDSCRTALSNFEVTDLQKSSSTKGDYLRDSIAEQMNINLISPAVVQQTLGNDYLKKEVYNDGKQQQERISINVNKIKKEHKEKELAHIHLTKMKEHLENYNKNRLKDFYTNIHSTEDIALCITASLYADKDDVIEGVKAKVFLPENYGSARSDGPVDNGKDNYSPTVLSELTSNEKSEMQRLVEQSKTPNTINYLENVTYKKYLNVIEKDLKLPRYSLESVCLQESRGKLYSGNNIIGSSAGAQGLFQFMPGTADSYMKHAKLKEKYGKTFTSRTEFLKDPLATAWAAGIMYSEFMTRYNYNFQSALACYNRGIGNYQKKIGGKGINLSTSNFKRLPAETKEYVEIITKNILQNNSDSSTDILLADLGKYSRGDGGADNFEYHNEFLIGPRLLAHNKDEIGGLGDSIMKGFGAKFQNMDGDVGKNTRNHSAVKGLSDEQIKQKFKQYKSNHPEVKSFMFYFGANNDNNQQTISDITKWSKWLQAEGIQPVLCTCVGENSKKTPWLKELNQQLIALGKEKNRPVLDFAKSYNKGDIALASDGIHPTSYSSMTNIVNSSLSQA